MRQQGRVRQKPWRESVRQQEGDRQTDMSDSGQQDEVSHCSLYREYHKYHVYNIELTSTVFTSNIDLLDASS